MSDAVSIPDTPASGAAHNVPAPGAAMVRDLPSDLPSSPGQTSRPAVLAVSISEAVLLASQHFDAGRRADAESICLQILASEPEQPDALHICGAIAHLAGKHGIALPLLEKAARLQPNSAQIQYNLGVVLGALRLLPRAAEHYRAALAIQPTHVNSLQNLGNIALESDNFFEARECYLAALAQQPDNAVLHLSMALLNHARRDVEQARAHAERALELAPDNVRIQWESAHILLLAGELERGWTYYEARFPTGAECKVWQYPFPFPRWQGEPLAGKHILIHGEQGLGDEMMFLSIVPELLEEGARVSLVGQPHLHPLWRDTFPQCACYVQLRANEDAWTHIVPEWLPQLGQVDYQIPFGSLALIRRRKAADFARQKPFIKVSPAKSGEWANLLDHEVGPRGAGKNRRLRVGLVWAGNPAPNNPVANRKDAKRSLLLSEFFPLARHDFIDWISLQTWQAAEQVKRAPDNFKMLDCSEHLVNFRRTAGLIDNLDLVITVDTSVCHLAGGMGKPVWILLPFVGEWRWGTDPDRSLWWPTARLFRQEAPWVWGDVIERVSAALEDLRPGDDA